MVIDAMLQCDLSFAACFIKIQFSKTSIRNCALNLMFKVSAVLFFSYFFSVILFCSDHDKAITSERT